MRRRLAAITIAVSSVGLAAIFVRLSLAWSDHQPYAGVVTERRYILLILCTLGIVAAGLASAIAVWRGGRGRKQ